jgi:hypothetical protein
MKRIFFISLVFLVFISAAQVPTSGLTAYWPLDGNANDATGNGNNGTNYGAALTTDRFGNANSAYKFDGVSNYISVPNSPTVDFANGTDFTVAFWMKTYSNNQDGLPICKQQYGSFSGYLFFTDNTNAGYCATPKHVSFYTASGAQQDACSDSAVTADTSWHFIAGIYHATSNTSNLYIDGVLQSDVGQSSGFISNTNNLVFGAHSIATTLFFSGALDDIRMYSNALTTTEIGDLYSERGYNPSPQSPTLSMYGPGAGNNCSSQGVCPSNAECGTYTACAGTPLIYTLGTLPLGAGCHQNLSVGITAAVVSGGGPISVSGSGSGPYTVIFSSPGTYHVSGHLYFEDCGCPGNEPPPPPQTYSCTCCYCYSTNWVTVTVLPNPLNPSLSVAPNPVCAGEPVCFTPSSLPATGTYTINPGNHSGTLPINSPLCYSYNAGTYIPGITISSAGCQKTATAPSLQVNPIQATISSTVTCNVVNLAANTTSCGGNNVTYSWQMLLGSTPVPNANATGQMTAFALNPTTYTVSLTVTNQWGSSATFTTTVTTGAQNCCVNTPGYWPSDATGGPRVSVTIPANSTFTISANETNKDFTVGPNSTVNIISASGSNVTKNLTLQSCTFLMGKGSQITILAINTSGFANNNTFNVTFNSCHLYGCAELWEGIRFSQGGAFVNYSSTLTINNTLFEDAWTGIDNSSAFSSGSGNNPPKIIITQSMFNRNHIDLNLNQFRLLSGSYSSGTAYTCRNFIPTLAPPFGPLPAFTNAASYYFSSAYQALSPAGVKPSTIHGVPGSAASATAIILFNPNSGSSASAQKFDLSANSNVFDRHYTGIWGRDINLTASKQYFYNIRNSSNGTAISAFGKQGSTGGPPTLNLGTSTTTANSFTNCDYGIYVQFPTTSLTASYNTFSDIDCAIRVDGFQAASGNYNCKISSNQIMNTRLNAIWFNVNSAINAHVDYNVINYSSGNANFTSKGIAVYEAGSTSALYTIEHNTIDYTYTGIECGGTHQTQITENTIQINTPPSCSGCYNFGINNYNCNNNSIGYNRITGNNIQYSWGEYGINSVDHPGQDIYCNSITGTNVGINLQGYSPTLTGKPIRNNDLHQEVIDFWLLNSCVVGAQVQAGNRPIDNILDHIGGTYLYNSYCSGYTSGNQSPFYARSNGLYKMPVNGADITSTLLTVTPSNIGVPLSCSFSHREGQTTLNITKEVAGDKIFGADDARNKFISRQKLFSQLMNEDTDTKEDNVVSGFLLENAAGTIGTLYLVEKNITEAMKNDDIKLIDEAARLNNSVNPSNTFESLQKKVNSAYLSYLSNNQVFSVSDLTVLRQIAGLCPFTEGTAVWQARSLLAGIDFASYMHSCETITIPTGAQQGSENSFTETGTDIGIFPNPNSGSFNVVFSNNFSETNIAVYNMLGVLVMKKEIKAGNENVFVVDGLEEGVYVVKVIADGSVLKTERIIVNK